MGDEFAVINGYRLRYRIEGRGPLAVFGHGLLGSIEQVEEQSPILGELEERVRLLVYDARGHGRSEGPEDAAGYTWETLGLDMCALAETAGEQRAIFGGGSMGAAAALWAAVERPEFVSALVLMVPPPLGFPEMRGNDERLALAALEALGAAVQNFGLEKSLEIFRQFPGFASSETEADQRSSWLREQNPLALSAAIPGLFRAPIHDPVCYETIRVPTLVIAHEGDGLHPVRAARLLAEHVPDCTLRVAPEPGWWWNHPDKLYSELVSIVAPLG